MKAPLTPSAAPHPLHPARPVAPRRRRTASILTLGALLLSGAQAAPLLLRATTGDARSPAVPVQVELSGGGTTRTLNLPLGGTLLDVPAGPYRLRLLSAGAALLSPAPTDPGTDSVPAATTQIATTQELNFTVSDSGTDLTVGVQPDVKVTLSVPAQAATGSTVTVTLSLSNAFSEPLTLNPELSFDEGLIPLSAARLTRELKAGQSTEIQIPVLIAESGDLNVGVSLAGLPGRADASVRGVTLLRAALETERDLRDPTLTRVRVSNPGLEATFPVTLSGPAGLNLTDEAGQPVTQLKLDSGETRTLLLRAPGTDDATPATISVGSSAARVNVGAQAALRTELTVSPADPLPGETVTVTLRAFNSGPQDLSGPLRLVAPAWLTLTAAGGADTPLTVPAGGEARRQWQATVPFGAAESGTVQVSGQDTLGAVQVSAPVSRTLLGLKLGAPAPVDAGYASEVPVAVHNPTGRAQTAVLSGAVGGEAAAEESVTVPPYGGAVARLSAVGSEDGVSVMTVTARIGEALVAAPQPGRLTFLPRAQATRTTEISLPFNVQGLSSGAVTAANLPPEGAAYLAGSAVLRSNDETLVLDEPKTGAGGKLYWALPGGVRSGVLSYSVAHVGPLGEPAVLDLSARVGDRTLLLSGELDPEDAARAAELTASEREGLIRSPRDGVILNVGARTNVTVEGPSGVPVTLTVNGETIGDDRIGEAGQAGLSSRLVFVGLPLQPGENLIGVRFGTQSDEIRVLVPGAAERLDLSLETGVTADGSNPVILVVRAVDASDLPGGNGQVTLVTDLEPVDPDADLQTAGYQVNLKSGVARVRLEPLGSARDVTVQAQLGELKAEEQLFVDVPGSTFITYQASAGVRYSRARGLSFEGQARGYAELPLAEGSLQASADTTGLPGLDSAATVGRRYPVTGSGTDARTALSSDLGVAFRYERRDVSLGYYDGALELAPLTGLPRSSALRGEYRDGPWSVRAFGARVPTDSLTETVTPDGGRTYTLSRSPRTGSERVVLIAGTTRRTLKAGQDYLLDALSGQLTLATPLSPLGPDFQAQELAVTYVPAGSDARQTAFGAGVEYNDGTWQVLAAAARLGTENGFSVQGAYRSLPLNVRASYQRGAGLPDGRATLNVTYRQGPVSGTVDYAYDQSRVTSALSGTAEVAYRQATFGVKLAHRTQAGQNRTALTYDRPLSPEWTVGAGAEYVWATPEQPGGVNAVALARYARNRAGAELQHSQPVLGGSRAQTRLNASYTLTSTTTLQARVQNTWGEGGALVGDVGVQQQLGNANLNVSYQLPGASGQSSRARFGVDVPINVTERVKANVSASVARDLSSGLNSATGSFGVRYIGETFSASLGTDASRTGTVNRLSVRGGATGRLGAHVLSVDGNVQVLPETQAQLTFSHAWRNDRVALLQYHRLSNVPTAQGADLQTGTVLEGEIGLDVQVPLNRRLLDPRPAPAPAPAPTPAPTDADAAQTGPADAQATSGTPAALNLSVQPSFAYRLMPAQRDLYTVQGGLSLSVPVTQRLSVGLNGYLIAQPGLNELNATYGADLRYAVSDTLRLVAGYTASASGTPGAGLTPGANPGVFIRADLFGGR
ncbi:hypothetical protein [Deinococcus knuensis]|uniref:DUF11 domain-containing protein n=1 Tax=Deinococcus knuensis TaxID=1837380 RepID=A0ABQ2SJ96_9DEIO|nr:hypothetical protein [Deinococcus knuensis]GGS28670.1 hypothetical protein GCM10008961_20420 [Deinococcus knuensis]